MQDKLLFEVSIKPFSLTATNVPPTNEEIIESK
jgi:hypothetical protein